MKTLLLASLLLLFAMPVWAEELLIDSVYLEYEQCATSKATVNGNTNAYCTPEAVKKKQPWYVISINTHPDPCLAKMEAAMRAMEFWLVLNIEDTAQVNLSIVQPDQYGNYWAVLPEEQRLEEYTPLGLTRLLNVKAAEAIVRWDTARRECWKEKP